MIDRPTLLSLVPHQGAMCLWDQVVDWDATRVRLITRSHTRRDNPLRSDASPGEVASRNGMPGNDMPHDSVPGNGLLRAVHLCEYGAQAMAVHGGLLARDAGAAPKPGLLVALRGVELHVARIDDLAGKLEGEAELLAAGEGSQQYAFRIVHAGDLLAEGRAAVMLQAAPP